MVDRHTDDKINKKARHAEFISASNQFARVGKILKRVQDDIKLGKFCSLLPAFTLAEVLITLGIIGVVAAMTIPTLMNKTNDAEFNSGLKKAYSQLSQAAMMLQSQNGTINVGNAAVVADMTLLRTDFCSVMTCMSTDTLGNMVGSKKYKFYKNGTDTVTWVNTDLYPAALLKDGTFLRFYSYADCSNNGVKACGTVIVDINGLKGPNMLGKDFFQFYITNPSNGAYSILPMGTQGDTLQPLPDGCTAGSTSALTSWGCTAQRLYDSDHMP